MLLSSSNRKYPTFPLLSYFSVVVCLRCLLHHILSLSAYTFRENREFVFITIVQFMMSASVWIRFGLQIVFVCLYSTPSHYYHCVDLSEGIEHIKCLSDIFVECESKIKHFLSVIHYTICGAAFFQFAHFPCDDWESTYAFSYYHNQIGNMNYYPLYSVRSWNDGVRCMSFYILIFTKDPQPQASDKVRLPPTFTSEPMSGYFWPGVREILNCSAKGVPKPKYVLYNIRMCGTILFPICIFQVVKSSWLLTHFAPNFEMVV